MLTIVIKGEKRVWRYWPGLFIDRGPNRLPDVSPPSQYQRHALPQNFSWVPDYEVSSEENQPSVCTLNGLITPIEVSDVIPGGNSEVTEYNLKWGYRGRRPRKRHIKDDMYLDWHHFLLFRSAITVASARPYRVYFPVGAPKVFRGKSNDSTEVMALLPSYNDEPIPYNVGDPESWVPGGREVSIHLGVFQGVRGHIANEKANQYSEVLHDSLVKDQVVDLAAQLVEIVELKVLFRNMAPGLRAIIELIGKASVGSPLQAYRTLKVAAAGWLEYSYGIKPVIQTMMDLIQKLPDAYKRANLEVREIRTKSLHKVDPLVYKYRFKAEKKTHVFNSNDAIPGCGLVTSTSGGRNYEEITFKGQVIWSRGDPDCGADYSKDCTLTIKQRAIYRAEQSWDRLLFVLGLNNISTAIWEGFPFSFVFDWYKQVGDFLTATGDMQGLKITHALITTTMTFEGKTSYGSEGYSHIRIRDALKADENGNLYVDVGFPHIPSARKIVVPPAIQSGTLVSKVDARMANAVSLLTLLPSYINWRQNLMSLGPLLPKSARNRYYKVVKQLFGSNVRPTPVPPVVPGGGGAY